MNEYPKVLDENERNLEKLQAIRGIEKKSAQAFLDHVEEFVAFIKECELEYKLSEIPKSIKKTYDESHPLFGKSVLLTGFRDKELENKVIDVGGKLASSVSKNTFAVLVKNLEETSGKVDKAKELGVDVLTGNDFVKKYLY
jgi:DNA ligase (NAD+)